jgi:hypothetical protein
MLQFPKAMARMELTDPAVVGTKYLCNDDKHPLDNSIAH